MNSKIVPNKRNSAILLASVLIAGFIGIYSPLSILAQEYYDDYETEEYSQYYDEYETEYNNYESYVKDDDPRPIIQKINCDNINNNPPININVDLSDGTNGQASSSGDASQSFSNGDSQSGQRIDRMNADGFPDQKGDFVFTCLNNNNLNVNANIENTTNFNTNNETTVNNLIIERNNAINQEISQSQEACTNVVGDVVTAAQAGDNSTIDQDTTVAQTNNCTVAQTQNPSNNASITDNSENDFSGAITSSSIANVEEPQAQTQQHVKVLQDGNGVEINQQGNQPIDIRQIKSSQNDNGIEIQQQGSLPIGITQQLEDLSIKDSPIMSQGIGSSPKLTALEKQQSDNAPELTATEKTTKLKQQWLDLLP